MAKNISWTLKEIEFPVLQKISREEAITIEQNEFDKGISANTLMEKAGQGIATHILSNISKEKNILVLAGTGNNGGDGSIAAVELYDEYEVEIIYLAEPKTIEGKKAKEICINGGVQYSIYPEIDIDTIKGKINNADVIIDAVFGVGLRSMVREPINGILSEFSLIDENQILISIDLPSGLDCNKGEWYTKEYTPNVILAIHYTKPCFSVFEGSDVLVEVIDISITKESMYWVSKNHFLNHWPKRDPNSHKGENGRVMVIGGSDEFTGAPVLTGMATLRMGVDSLRIAVPETIRDIVAGYAEDFIVVKVNGPRHTYKGFKKYKDMALRRHDVIVIGMGMSNHPDCIKFTRDFFSESKDKIKWVLDAEAIRAFKGHVDLLKGSNAIISPHKAELRMLFGDELPSEFPELVKYVQEKAKEIGITIVLKGRIDIITNGVRTLLNSTGHPGMTVGGSGDVLAGVIAAAYSVIDDPFIATAISTYIMGKAGEYAAEEYGNSLIASDIILKLPEFFLIHPL